MTSHRGFNLMCAATVFLVAMAIRLLFCFVAIDAFDLPMGPRTDAFFKLTDGYTDLAVNLADHHRFAFESQAPPTTYRAPAYPFVLAIGYRLCGNMAQAVLLINCIASAATCVVVYAIAARWLGHQRWPLIMMPTLLFPLSIYYCASSYSDTFFSLMVALYFLSLLWVVSRPRLSSSILSGFLFAAALLTKSILLPFPLLILLYSLRHARAAVPSVVVSVLLGLVITSVWTVRNHQVSGCLIPISGGAGFNMLIGTYMIEKGSDPGTSYVYAEKRGRELVGSRIGFELSRASLRTGHHLDLQPRLDREFGRAAWHILTEDPLLMARKVLINLWRFWTFSSSSSKTFINTIIQLETLALAGMTLRRLGSS